MIDKKDEKILSELMRDAKQTSKHISRRTLIPITTVHNRIKKMEKSGIIKNYTIKLDDQKLGTISAFIMVTVDYKFLKSSNLTQQDLAKNLKTHPKVESTGMVTGNFDIVLKVRVANVGELDEFITRYLRNVEGIEKTQTMILLNEN